MHKILIIEDDQIVANVYRNKFSLEGFQVEIAFDGHAGLEMVRSFRPDAIVLDLVLPKLSGVELMKILRAEADFQHLPVIVFSNTYLTQLVQDAWKAGATKCLSKSNCTPRQVIDVVRSTLSNNGTAKPVSEKVGQWVSGKNHPSHSPTHPLTHSPTPDPLTGQSVSEKVSQSVSEKVSEWVSGKEHPSHSPTHPPTHSPRPPDAAAADAEFQAELRKSFLESLPGTLGALRALLQRIIKAENEPARLKQIHELYRRIHAITGNSGLAGMLQIAQMADALEALLKELHDKPKNINVSTLRTIASSIDFLAILFDRATLPELQEMAGARILVVDDEAISRRAITYALEKAKLKSVNIDDPAAAYKLLSEDNDLALSHSQVLSLQSRVLSRETLDFRLKTLDSPRPAEGYHKFDLIFLDVDMPGMNGFELCTKLRNLPAHKKTPVVFVTSLNDFESRANSTMSGGNDFIAKPFLFIELAVKALVYILRGRFLKS